MRVDDLKRLYDYNYWANTRLHQSVARLTPEEFTRNVAGSYGSIRNTLVHTMSAEWGWLDRCGGPPRGPRLAPRDYPTLASVLATWSTVEGFMRAFLSSLDEKDLTRSVEFAFGKSTPQTGSLSDMMQHAANHAVHHRGQVALLIRMLGHVPGDFDMLFYDGERLS